LPKNLAVSDIISIFALSFYSLNQKNMENDKEKSVLKKAVVWKDLYFYR